LIFTSIKAARAKTLLMGTSDHWPMVTTSDQIGVSTSGQFPAVNWKVFERVLGLLQEYWAKELDPRNIDDWYGNYTRFLAALKGRVTQWKNKERYRPSYHRTFSTC
jgi:hypothetical protein